MGYVGTATGIAAVGYLIKRIWQRRTNLQRQPTTSKKEQQPLSISPDIKYKIRDELLPYKDKLRIGCIHHPAVLDYITEKDVEYYIDEPREKFCGTEYAKALIQNPYLESLFRKMVFEDKNETLANRNLFLNHCPYPDILQHYKETNNWNIDWFMLASSTNPGIIQLIELNLKKLEDWSDLSANPLAIDILKKNIKQINWFTICYNEKAGELLYFNQDMIPTSKVCWNLISRNQSHYKLLDGNFFRLDWNELSANPSEAAILLLKENPDKINWDILSSNPGAAYLLETNLDKVNWDKMSLNESVVHLLVEHPNKINWDNFSLNESASDLLIQNPHKVNWKNIVKNKNIPVEFLTQHIDKIHSYLNYAILRNPNLANLVFIEV
jgi:hypothetical protein